MSRLIYMLTIFPVLAFAQYQMPSDVDLKTAYCFAPLKSRIELGEGARPMYQPGSAAYLKAEKFVEQSKDDLNRARGYLISKMSYLDPTALLIAQKRGESDVVSSSANIDQCISACGSLDQARNDSEFEKLKDCMRQCDGGPPGKRIKTCNTLDWLPY